MRIVIQRVSHASVVVEEAGYSAEIGPGLLVLAGFTDGDGIQDMEWVARKLSMLRIFDDKDGVMNLSVSDIHGDIMIISQFTLYAMTAKGNRPSYIKAARPENASPLYDKFCEIVSGYTGKSVKKGIFGADMKVSLLNDGPVTIMIDSKNRE